MCGMSKAKLRDLSVRIDLGYHGGSLTIGDIKVKDNSSLEDKTKMKSYLNTFKKSEIINMIIELVENADED